MGRDPVLTKYQPGCSHGESIHSSFCSYRGYSRSHNLSDLKRDFLFLAYGTSLIDCGSHFLRICRINHPKLSDMNQKIASDHRSLYFCDFEWFHYVLQVLCGQVYARRGFFFNKKHVPRFFEHVFSWFGQFSSILGSHEACYIDCYFIFFMPNTNIIFVWKCFYLVIF